MAGQGKGALTAQMFGARLGTNHEIRMKYIPAHNNMAGKKVNARLSAPFILNLRGKEGGVRYQIITWGALGDMFTKNWNEGKEMHFPQLEHNPHLDVVFSRVDRSIIMDKDGQPLKAWRDSWILRDFRWGAESMGTLQREMHTEGCSDGSGRRPINWNQTNHADNAAWKQILEMRKNTFFSPQHLAAGVFGFADVVMPRGGGQILFGGQYEKEAVVYQGSPPVMVDPNYNPGRTRFITAPAAGTNYTTTAKPNYGAPGAPGAPHVPNANVPLTTQVHTALTQTHCVKCGTPITAGNPFCGNCGNAVVAAAEPGMGPGAGMPAGMPMGYVPVAGAPGAIPATAGAPFMG